MAAVLTWHRDTVIDIVLTVAARHAGYTGAGEIVDHVVASRALRTRIAVAFVDIDFAIYSSVAGLANAFVGVDLIVAGRAILTRMTQALIHIRVTVFTRKTGRTIALVRALFILTNAITANIRIQGALIHILRTRTTRPARRTAAGVLAIRQIRTDATIATRLCRASRADLILRTNALIQLAYHWL